MGAAEPMKALRNGRAYPAWAHQISLWETSKSWRFSKPPFTAHNLSLSLAICNGIYGSSKYNFFVSASIKKRLVYS